MPLPTMLCLKKSDVFQHSFKKKKEGDQKHTQSIPSFPSVSPLLIPSPKSPLPRSHTVHADLSCPHRSGPACSAVQRCTRSPAARKYRPVGHAPCRVRIVRGRRHDRRDGMRTRNAGSSCDIGRVRTGRVCGDGRIPVLQRLRKSKGKSGNKR